MANNKPSKTKSAVIVRKFSDGEAFRRSYTDDVLSDLMEAVRMYAFPDLKAKAERRLREYALIMAEHKMREYQKALLEAQQNEAIEKLMADPKFDGLDTLKKDAAIAKAVGVHPSKVRQFRPKRPRGRPRKSD